MDVPPPYDKMRAQDVKASVKNLITLLYSSHTNEYLREAREEECSGGSAASHPRQLHPHKLNERERKQAALPILIFGYPLVSENTKGTYLQHEKILFFRSCFGRLEQTKLISSIISK